jgi:hypothetical protein
MLFDTIFKLNFKASHDIYDVQYTIVIAFHAFTVITVAIYGILC